MKKDYLKIIITILLGLSGLLLIVGGFYYLFGLKQMEISYYFRLFYSISFIIDGLLYLICAYGILKRIKPFYYLAIVILALNIVLFIFEEIGLIDIAALALNIVILVLVVLEFRKSFPKSRTSNS